MKDNLTFKVAGEMELLLFLRECFPSKSRNYVKGLLARGQVSVDGRKETHYAKELMPGQTVEVQTKPSQPSFEPDFPIIFESEEILVIDKPAGMLSISTEKERENTAYHIVTDYIKSKSPLGRVFIVHRLDKETSGIMLFAKNEKIKNEFQDNWDDLVTYRGYTAVVEGKPENQSGQVISWLKQTRTLVVYSSDIEGVGKKAITNYSTTQTNENYSLMDISIDTGRKNQIRVHMNDLGCPVAGDKKYGAKTNPLTRLCLHAGRLTLRHPITGETMDFKSVAPKAFTKITSPK